MKQHILLGVLFGILFCCCSCATKPIDPEELKIYEETNDPLEPMNRTVFAFNNLVDETLLKPTARGYRAVTTQTMRTGVTNFYDNLDETRNVLNGVLQANPIKTSNALKRFLANTFWGFFGLMDVASDMDIPKYDNDFGQTLAVWGWETSDTYLVLPLMGPSNPRDALGTAGNFVTPPSVLITMMTPWTSYPLTIGNYIQMRERSIEFLDNLHRSSTDYYATVRSMSRQNRQKVINDALGHTETEAPKQYEFDMDFDDFE